MLASPRVLGGTSIQINVKVPETWPSFRAGVGITRKVGVGVWWGNRETSQLSFC